MTSVTSEQALQGHKEQSPWGRTAGTSALEAEGPSGAGWREGLHGDREDRGWAGGKEEEQTAGVCS